MQMCYHVQNHIVPPSSAAARSRSSTWIAYKKKKHTDTTKQAERDGGRNFLTRSKWAESLTEHKYHLPLWLLPIWHNRTALRWGIRTDIIVQYCTNFVYERWECPEKKVLYVVNWKNNAKWKPLTLLCSCRAWTMSPTKHPFRCCAWMLIFCYEMFIVNRKA